MSRLGDAFDKFRLACHRDSLSTSVICYNTLSELERDFSVIKITIVHQQVNNWYVILHMNQFDEIGNHMSITYYHHRSWHFVNRQPVSFPLVYSLRVFFFSLVVCLNDHLFFEFWPNIIKGIWFHHVAVVLQFYIPTPCILDFVICYSNSSSVSYTDGTGLSQTVYQLRDFWTTRTR